MSPDGFGGGNRFGSFASLGQQNGGQPAVGNGSFTPIFPPFFPVFPSFLPPATVVGGTPILFEPAPIVAPVVVSDPGISADTAVGAALVVGAAVLVATIL